VVDLSVDGTVEIVASTCDGGLFAFDGESLDELWSTESSEPSESYDTPAIGHFDDDGVPDVLASFSFGVFANYSAAEHIAVSGATGQELYRVVREETFHSSPLVLDVDDDGLDEVLIWANSMGLSAQRLLAIDVADQSVVVVMETPEGGVSTPWIGDLDADSVIDVVWHTQTGEDFETAAWHLRRMELNVQRAEPLPWGAYLGSGYDGVWRGR